MEMGTMNAIRDLAEYQDVKRQTEQPITSVFFGNVFNTTQPKIYSWPGLCDLLMKPPAVLQDNRQETKAAARQGYYVRGLIEGNRDDAHLTICYLLILDIDKPAGNKPLPTVLDFHRAFKGIKHAVYNTATPGRLRAVFPVAPYHKSESGRLTWALYHYARREGLNFSWAGESEKKSQPFFLPQSTAPERHQAYCCKKGTEFSPDFIDDVPPYREKEECSENPDHGGEPHNHLEEFIAELQSGTIHEAAKKYAGWVHRTSNLTTKQIFDQLSTLVNHHCADRAKVKRWESGEREKFENWFAVNVKNKGQIEAFEALETTEASRSPLEAHLKPFDREFGWAMNVLADILPMFEGEFTNKDVYSEVSATIRIEKRAIAQALRRMASDNKIKKIAGKNATYKVIDNEENVIDIFAPLPEPVSVPLPLGISEFAVIRPKSVILLAGSQNAGKTGILLWIAKQKASNFDVTQPPNTFLNREKKSISPVTYLNSEMSASELGARCKTLTPENMEVWRGVKFKACSRNFEDKIDPTGFNIVDYLEIHEDFFNVGKMINAIFEALTTGIAIVAIQKKTGEPFGKGGYMTLEKPRLVINLDKKDERGTFRAKIAKLKEPVEFHDNRNGMECDYRFLKGGGIEAVSNWHYPTRGKK